MPRPPKAKNTTVARRGLPKKDASRNAPDAPGDENQPEDHEAEKSRPAKRGCKPKSTGEDKDAPKKRGRPSTGGETAAPKKRGRPSTGGQTTKDAHEGVKKGKRTAPRSEVQQDDEPEREPENEEPQQKSRKRPRASLEQDEEESVPKRLKGRPGRPSLGEVPASNVQNKAPNNTQDKAPSKRAQKKPGRPSLTKSASQAQPREEQEKGEESSIGNLTSQSAGRRRSSEALPARSPSKANAALLKQIPHVVPKERQLPISTIHARWRPLELPARNTSSEILRLASVPVLQTCPAGPRRDFYSQAIEAVIRQVTRQQAKKLPFPMASQVAQATARKSKTAQADGRERELDRQMVEHDVCVAEAKLTPLVHSVQILKAEVNRMQAVLETEHEQLMGLEGNVKAAKSVWDKGLKKAHRLVPDDKWLEGGEKGERLELVKEEGSVSTMPLFKDLPDGELKTLAKQASSHIESMKANVGQVADLLPLINDSRAVLRTVLHKHLPKELYEEAVMSWEGESP